MSGQGECLAARSEGRRTARPKSTAPSRNAPRTGNGWRPARSVEREVVRVLVSPGPLELDLHQDVVEEARGPETEPVRRHPARTERLVQDHEVLDRFLGRADP